MFMNSSMAYNNQSLGFGNYSVQEMDWVTASHHHICNNSQNIINSSVSNILSSTHVTPSLHTSRNIYINKALYYNNESQNLGQTLPSKSERIYYNPKFFNNNNTNIMEITPSPCQKVVNKDLPKKQETNIYLNPRFIKNAKLNGANTVQEFQRVPSGTVDSSVHRSGIHFNPKFIQEHVNTEKNDYLSSSKDIPPKTAVNPISEQSDLNHQNSLLNQYVSKYKIVRKELNTSDNGSHSHLKNNTKKTNFPLVVKNKYKLNRIKSINYASYPYSDKYSPKKYYTEKIQPISVRKWLSQKSVAKLKESETRILRVNCKMSLLQHKIQARRKGKSSFASNCYRYQFLSSKYINRKIVVTSQKSFRSSKNHYIKHHYHKSHKKMFNNETACDKSAFKWFNKLKLVRTSKLQTQIELRHIAKKSTVQLQRVSAKNEGLVSKPKPERSSSISKRSPCSIKNNVQSKKNPMKFSSDKYRTDKIRRLHNLTKKLRKNNQPCPFYSRYGRCKGKEKGSCLKLHDPKYISICRKFLKGECTEENCTLSHDIRPEKMPTCYHYLAGLCKRTNCPYLHIKVNQKAPICRSFLQGFCADVYNCNKRHEFICPSYAEKGHCSKGKSCSLPHRTPKMYSKLLEPDQFPLLNTNVKKKRLPSEVSKTGCHSTSDEKVSGNCDNDEKEEVDAKKKEGNDFQRYFLAPLEPINDPVDDDDNR